MAYNLGETIGPMLDKGELDKLVHHFIVKGNIEWKPKYLNRANAILAQHNWQVDGKYMPMDEYGPSGHIFELVSPVDAVCRYEQTFQGRPGILLVANLAEIGQAVLPTNQGLINEDGVPFPFLYDVPGVEIVKAAA